MNTINLNTGRPLDTIDSFIKGGEAVIKGGEAVIKGGEAVIKGGESLIFANL